MTGAARSLRGPLRKKKSLLWERDTNDWYVEPEWCSVRLFEAEAFEGRIWDPACGSGRILKAAKALGLPCIGTDLIGRGCGGRRDFMKAQTRSANIVSNPPFGIAMQFVSRALELADRKVAMLLPANWVQGDKRGRWLAGSPLRRVWFISPRPSMPPGAAIAAGERPGNGTTDYAWFVWLKGYDGYPEIRWLHRDAA